MADTNVVTFPGETTREWSVDQVLHGAVSKRLSGVVVIGYDADEKEYFASSYADGRPALWLIERLKAKILAD